ncbi:MAG: UbiA family prenyltransferase, partial [Candidatus Omnitrophota bacterium]
MKETKRYLIWKLIRPFTLLAPAVGFFSGAVIGSRGFPPAYALLGIASAVFLNAASNVVNQIFDLEIDRLNKPDRILPSGKLSVRQATWIAVVFSILAFAAAYLVPNKQFFAIVLLAAFITFFYSSPPLRVKRCPFLANFWIAIPRGTLLLVSGWASVRDVWDGEIWVIGALFGLFVFGATTTKDFSDVEGDRRYGCLTLPALLGFRGAALFMVPFLTLSFLGLPLAREAGLLQGRQVWLFLLGVFLFLWGCYITWLILRKPEALAVDKNHPSW